MKQKGDDKLRIAKLRKIERQAKLLIYKMKHLEKDWDEIRSQVKTSGQNLPKKLGDALARWHRLPSE